MKATLTYIFIALATVAFAQESELSYNNSTASIANEVVSTEKAESNARLIEKCCNEYINNHTVCLQEMPANYVNDIIGKYPEGFSEETIKEADATTIKYIFVKGDQVKTLEKKTWNWGGEFYYKNYLCPITSKKFLQELEALMDGE